MGKEGKREKDKKEGVGERGGKGEKRVIEIVEKG